ncbi:zinc-dependent alcohol dehydrogenase family protein [Spongisporangium articulatum]|uniref:Zinc-dependent alcohol dehydrogenase family protein n=1 Tax=Spongisporangium articulatum TaxID=3362603 RepID=A0ABW8AQU2_9ACTN
MRAAVVTGVGTVSVETVPDPTPGPRDVVISVAGCGICGTDLHILGGQFAPSLPIVPGHEFAGEIVAVGAEVRARFGLAVGDRVAADPNQYCGECYQCRRGRGNLCENFAAVGVTLPGAAAEYVVAAAANCVKLPEGLAVSDAALIEPLSCSVHGFDVLPRDLGASYLIYGAGTMGLMNLELAKRAGAGSVDVVEPNGERLGTARLLGCSSAATDAAELERPRGWDVVIDCTGVVAAIEDGLSRVAQGGHFLQFGVADMQAVARFNPYRVFREEITIVGSFAVQRSYERAAALFFGGLLDPDVFISDRYPLAAYPAALDQVRRGIGRKVLVDPRLS